MTSPEEREKGLKRTLTMLRWIAVGILTGCIAGLAGTAFAAVVRAATGLRTSYTWLVFFLPLAGLCITYLYQKAGLAPDPGTGIVLSSISGKDEVPFRQSVTVFVSAVLTHLFGGSAGRLGAALQIGSGIATGLAKPLKLTEKERKIITMCGISACFAAVFGTPLTATFFALEVASVGVMYYVALVPCALAALVAAVTSSYFGFSKEMYLLETVPAFQVKSAVTAVLLSMAAGVVSMLFCFALHYLTKLAQSRLTNAYLRTALLGALLVLLTLLTGYGVYAGTGTGLIRASFAGEAPRTAFLWKTLFTALTVAAGFKGGEITPSLAVGATFGCLCAGVLPLDPGLCAAIGMAAVFAGVTNCPVSALFLSYELFGGTGMPYYLIAVAFGYTFSGYYSLYGSQRIVYSKYEHSYVNEKTR